MKWSIPIGRVLGISIRIHATFLLLLGYVAWAAYDREQPGLMVWAVATILAIFVCVGLHELGHSVVAQRLGVQVKSITFLPIGGVAGMRTIPENPRHELAITVAGPLVNVVIAALMIVMFRGLDWTVWPFTERFWPYFPPHNAGTFLETLLRANIVMVIFNLIPAFPMDGGRILRALLAMVLRYVRATSIAVTIGQAIAILFFVYGIARGGLMFPIIGFFIFWAAEMEERMVRMRSALRDLEVDDVMNRNFVAVNPQETIAHCLEKIYQTGQEDFPVLDDGHVVGLLTRRKMLEAVHRQGTQTPVANVMDGDFVTVSSRTSLAAAHEEMMAGGHSTFPVMEDGHLAGLLSQENITRYFLLTNEIRRKK